ncbi:MAG: methyltransferase domain-containing protein [Hyphomicrobiaceae bacterium]|nr:methyltransferase domain-containing protein [Hyphomicrobiaceae bacterium]
MDVVELRDFYARPLGALVRRLVSRRIREHWGSVAGLNTFGLGYATPYLGAFRNEAARLGALMPGHIGGICWPREGPLSSVLVDEDALPLPDGSVDRLLVVHSLEFSERVRPTLREIWRVLAPEGRILFIVPNRRSIWARLDSTPFGHGRPYSRAQLLRLLDEALFTVVATSTSLHVPPMQLALMLGPAPAWERAGRRLWPAFSGLILVEARKEMMAPVGKGARAVLVPQLSPERLGRSRIETIRCGLVGDGSGEVLHRDEAPGTVTPR